MGYDKIYLWVLEQNVMARRFYEKNGSVVLDEKVDSIGGVELVSVRYGYDREFKQ